MYFIKLIANFTHSWFLKSAAFISLLLIAIAYFYMTRHFQYWKKRGFAEIRPVPFFGNFGEYFKNQKSPTFLLKSFYDQSEGLPYVGIYILDKPCLLLRDPEIIKRILIRDFNFFSDKFTHSSKKDNISNNSIFFINNPYWKFVRQQFTSLFTIVKLKRIFDNVQEVEKDLYNYLDSLQLEDPGKEINIKELTEKFTIDLYGLIAYGLKLNCLNDPNAKFREYAKRILGTYSIKRAIEITSVFLAPQFATIFGFRFILENTLYFFRNTFQGMLDERIMSKVKKEDLIDLLIQLRDIKENDPESFGFKFEGDNILSQVLVLFMAGYETSSSVITYSLFELAKNPEIQSKLRSEINDSMEKNKKIVTYEMVAQMQFLDMIISETMRKYPTMPILDRKATRDYTIEESGLIIEKGTPILIPLLGLHYDSKYFPEPDIFDPERFSTENKSLRNPYVYIPFGTGPRSCMGIRQGLLQIKLFLIYFISKYEVFLLNKSCIEFNKWSALSSLKNGLFLRVKKIGINDN